MPSYKLPVLKDSAALRYFTFFYLYAMQGIPAGFALTAIANYFIGKGVNALAIGQFDAVIGIPWVVQFIWGPLIDRYQFSTMGNRKHWTLLSQLLAFCVTLSLLWISHPVEQLKLIMTIFFIHSIFASVQDASVDATAIAVVPEHERGRINAYMRIGLLLGGAFGAAGLSTVLHSYGFYTAALCQSVILLLLTGFTYLIKVERGDSYLPSFHKNRQETQQHSEEENPTLRWLFKQLYKGITQKESLRVFSVIALVYLCLSIFTRSLTFQLIHYLHWNDNQLSVLQGTWGSVVTIAVTFTGGYIADRVGAVKLEKWVIVVLCIFFLIFGAVGAWWIHKQVSIAGILMFSLADPIFSVACMPILMALCYVKVEGSQFTTYMAIINLCDIMGAYISGWGMSVTRAPVICLLCGVSILIAISFMAYHNRRNKLALNSVNE